MKRIESNSNRKVQLYRGLGKRGMRAATGMMAVEGVRIVTEALRSKAEVPQLFFSDDFEESAIRDMITLLERRLDKRATAVYRMPAGIFRKMTHTVTPQGVAAVVHHPVFSVDLNTAGHWQKVVILCQPRDPGNIGTILRSAEAADFQGVVLIEPSCDPYNPKAVRASMGSIFRMPVFLQPSVHEVVNHFSKRGFHLLVADPRADQSLYDLKIETPVAMLFGGETTGPPPLGRDQAQLFSLPMGGEVESLNLAQAASVALYEFKRRQLGTLLTNNSVSN